MNDVLYRVKHAVQAQNVFRHLVRKAEAIGMKVNAAKTTMVCFSDAAAYKADAYIEDEDGNRIGCQDRMKALGMRFSNRPDMGAHVDWIRKTYRERFWMLRNLKRNGFTNPELVQVYKTMIRPVAEYTCVVYHSSLTDEQDELLDNLQNHALRCIFKSEKRLSGRKLPFWTGSEQVSKSGLDKRKGSSDSLRYVALRWTVFLSMIISSVRLIDKCTSTVPFLPSGSYLEN